MTHHLNKLCSEFLIKAQSESDLITNQIKSSYKEGNNKENLEEEYRELINNFLSTYRNTFVGITNADTNEVLGLDKECSHKLEVIVKNLKNYITDLKQ